jgi:hypothetical protein
MKSHATILLAVLAACSTAPDRAAPEDRGTGLNMRVQAPEDSDVTGFHFAIQAMPCAPGETAPDVHETYTVDLLDVDLPAGADIDVIPFETTANHRGADVFTDVPPGCYDVVAVPVSGITSNGFAPSETCSAANGQAEVFDGHTSELTLISQCEGEPTGALDVLALTNTAPTLEVRIEDKFPLECEPTQVCATVTDPDDDPVEIVLEQTGGPALFTTTGGHTELVGFENGQRIWEACFEPVVHYAAEHTFELHAYDLGTDANGDAARLEDLIDPDSHASLAFPLYGTWQESVCHAYGDLHPQSGDWAERVPGCDYIDNQEYWCELEMEPEAVPFVCDDDGQLIVEAAYPACDAS